MAIAYDGVARQTGWPAGDWFAWKAPLCGVVGFLASMVIAFLHIGLVAALVVAAISLFLILPLVMGLARVWSQPIALVGMTTGALWVVVGYLVRH
jgi:energy-coupling factor transporter transmembrane protein EcfT